jgi:hypothetical protein
MHFFSQCGHLFSLGVHMISFSKSIAVLVASGILTACATAGKDVASTYVSPMQYSNYDCEQLRSESMRISSRVNQLTGRLDEAASNDKAIAGVGMILFWPALFALGGTKQQEAELSRLKGEYDAIETTATTKKCAA